MCLSSHKHTYPYMESAGGGRVALILKKKRKELQHSSSIQVSMRSLGS